MEEERSILEFQVINYDRDFYKLLEYMNEGYLGIVHSIYSKVINFLSKTGKIYSITSEKIDNGPFSLKVNSKGIDFKELNIREKDKVFKINGFINIAGKINFKTNKKTNLWIAKTKKVENINKDILNKNIKYFNKIIFKRENPSGSKYYYFRDNPNFRYKPQIIERELFIRIERFLEDIRQDELDKRSIISLIGLGIGLTPSGDDFLVGFISVLNIIDIDYSRYLKGKIIELINIDKVSTTDISKHMLENALEGKFKEGIINFIYSLLEEDRKKLEKSIKNILNIGSSSGMDLSIGIIVAIKLLMNNLNMEE